MDAEIIRNSDQTSQNAKNAGASPDLRPSEQPGKVAGRTGLSAVSILGLSLAAFVLFGAGIIISVNFLPRQVTAPAKPTPTQIPPASQRQINPIATTSAYMDLEKGIKDLSESVNGFNAQNSSLVPPVLDLPLGFSK